MYSAVAHGGMSEGQYTTSRCDNLCCHVMNVLHLAHVGLVGGELGHRKELREGRLWGSFVVASWEVAPENVATLYPTDSRWNGLPC